MRGTSDRFKERVVASTHAPRRDETYEDTRIRKRILNAAKQNQSPCSICGQPINYKTHYNAADAPTVDHIRSWRDHPELRRDLGNLAVAHRACNTSKGVKPAALPAFGNASRDWSKPRG